MTAHDSGGEPGGWLRRQREGWCVGDRKAEKVLVEEQCELRSLWGGKTTKMRCKMQGRQGRERQRQRQRQRRHGGVNRGEAGDDDVEMGAQIADSI